MTSPERKRSAMSTTSTTGRNWLDMGPQHFDSSLLPRKHRRPEAEGLFSVADVAPSAPPKASTTAPELDGQGDLLSLLEE